MSKRTTPNPGSDAAVEAGCTCAVMDNRRGLGVPFQGETCFWISDRCPVHALTETPPSGKEEDEN
jgi:hypothetical protein